MPEEDLKHIKKVEMANKGEMSKTKKAAGLYCENFGEKIYKWMKEGNSLTQCAAFLGVSRNELLNWRKDPSKKKFAQYIERGETALEASDEALLHDLIMGKVKGPIIGQMYRMKCRWRERWLESIKQEIDVTNKNISSPDEFDNKILELLGKKSNRDALRLDEMTNQEVESLAENVIYGS